MTIIQSIILGIVEGVTEFLPISSTFHLVWTAKFLGLEQTDSQKLFEIAIQSGAILAVGVGFIKTSLRNVEIIKKVLVAFIPTAIIGFALYKIIKNVFLENLPLQLCMFIAIGVVFILFEYLSKRSYTRSMADITYKEALFVGVAQALAVVPGVSRSGAVILALMMLSVKREDAATFSFLLAVPTILGATALDLFKSHTAIESTHDASLLAVGFIASFFAALIVVRWFIAYLQRHTISIFGWYRIALGIVLALVLIGQA